MTPLSGTLPRLIDSLHVYSSPLPSSFSTISRLLHYALYFQISKYSSLVLVGDLLGLRLALICPLSSVILHSTLSILHEPRDLKREKAYGIKK